MRGLLASLLFISGLGCSVEKARIDGNPPTTENVLFKAGALDGQLVSSSSTVFLWPVEKNGKPLTRDEDIALRAEVIAMNAAVSQMTQLKAEYEAKRLELAEQFKADECGLFDAFFPVPNAEEVWDWKEPETPEEEIAINKCKDIQASREKIRVEKLVPLGEEIAKTNRKLVYEVLGQGNYFAEFESLTVQFTGTPRIQTKGFSIPVF